MIPLLFIQSLLIGAGFGIGYQGLRRKLSAMDNDTFNKTNLGTYAFDEFKGILARNDFGQMLNLMHPLTDKLADAFGQFLNKMPSLAGSVIDQAINPEQSKGLKPPFGVASFITPITIPYPNPEQALKPVQDYITSQQPPDTSVADNAMKQFRDRILSGYYNYPQYQPQTIVDAYNSYTASDKNTLRGKFEKELNKLMLQESKAIADKAAQRRVEQIEALQKTATQLQDPDYSVVPKYAHHHDLVAASKIIEQKLQDAQLLVTNLDRLYGQGKVGQKAYDNSMNIYKPQVAIYTYTLKQYRLALKQSIS